MKHSQVNCDSRIVVKIGTESILGENGLFGGRKMEIMCSDISHLLHKTSSHVALVSSGAVGFGKQFITKEIHFDEMIAKQYLASIGQTALMSEYAMYFRKHHVYIGEILVTHADIEDSEVHADSIRNVLESHFSLGTLPVINENDTTSSEEIQALKRGADNDKNALLISRLIGAQVIYIITNTDGVYQELDNAASRIASISAKELTDGFIKKITGGKSKNETGGMQSKLEVVREAAQYGIETHIIDGVNSTLRGHYYNKTYGGTIILPV